MHLVHLYFENSQENGDSESGLGRKDDSPLNGRDVTRNWLTGFQLLCIECPSRKLRGGIKFSISILIIASNGWLFGDHLGFLK